MSDWQPIDTAPKDGTLIVLFGRLESFGGYPRACVSRWCDHEDDSPAHIKGWPFMAPGYIDRFLPTHWMPLPLAQEPQP